MGWCSGGWAHRPRLPPRALAGQVLLATGSLGAAGFEQIVELLKHTDSQTETVPYKGFFSKLRKSMTTSSKG